MDAYVWFGLLMTLLYAVVLPLLMITAGIRAAEVGAARNGSAERRLGGHARGADDE